MMYNDKLVVAVKAQGKILREHKDTALMPFGTEYSILIKNKNTVRALVRVEIDGTDVTGGTQLIVGPNSSIDLERFIKNGNLKEGNRFKFIERTQKIEEHRGIGAEDGLVRVEFEFERAMTTTLTVNNFNNVHHYVNPWPNPLRGMPPYYAQTSDAIGPTSADSLPLGVFAGYAQCANLSAESSVASATLTTSANEVGITVPGSVSDQQFTVGGWFPTDGVQHVIIMKLRGEVKGEAIVEPVTVKTKSACSTCGTKNKGPAKFCQECGTALNIV